MTLSSFGIALLPTYDQLGYTGAIMLLAIRVIQGIIIGGQTPAAFIVLCEENNFRHPNLIASITSIFTYIGVILGQFLTYILTIIIGSNSMAVWGWRLLFLLIGCFSVFIYFIQKKIPIEDKKKHKMATKKIPYDRKSDAIKFIFVFLVIFLLGIELYTASVAIPNYLVIEHTITLKQNISLKLVLAMSCLILTGLFAYIADILKLRLTLLIIPSTFIFVMSLLITLMHINYQSILFEYTSVGLIILLYCATISVIYPIITQLFQANRRASLIGISYGIGNTLSVIVSTNIVSYLSLRENSLTPSYLFLLSSSAIFLIYLIMLSMRKIRTK